MRILVDADACPVKKEIENVASKYKLELLFFADFNHQLKSNYGQVIIADQGADSVDLKLINQMKKKDIIITQDYGVASLALGKSGLVLHPSGRELHTDNIDMLMFERHIGRKQRKQGKYGTKHKKRTDQDNQKFLEKLTIMIDRELAKGI